MESERKVGKRAYIFGATGILVTVAMAVVVVLYWEEVRALEGYGYLGNFIISVLGGATVIIPVPMLAVQFALGGVLNPVFVGLTAGFGETVAALIIYMTGYGGGTPFVKAEGGRIHRAYMRLMGLMERRGSLVLFILSAVVNPFFYPAALAAGALRFGVRRYFLICLLGKTAKGFTVAYAGFFGLRGILGLLGMPG